MKKLGNMVATVGSYLDAEGNEKKRYVRCGALFSRDDGSMTMKLDSIPVGAEEFNGWMNCYPDEDKKEGDVPF